MPQSSPTTLWRYFPHAMLGALAVVIMVNAGMIWTAYHTFPGVAATDVFDASNRYDSVIAQAGREAALGWRVRAEADPAVLVLTDQKNVPLTGARIEAQARRPVGPDQSTMLTYVETTPGRYLARSGLPQPGRWDLRVTVVRDTQVLHATRRVEIR